MGGKVTGKSLIEAGGLPIIFFGGGIGGRFKDSESGSGLTGVVADESGPGLGSGFGFEEEIGFSPGFLRFGILPEEKCDSGNDGKSKGN